MDIRPCMKVALSCRPAPNIAVPAEVPPADLGPAVQGIPHLEADLLLLVEEIEKDEIEDTLPLIADPSLSIVIKRDADSMLNANASVKGEHREETLFEFASPVSRVTTERDFILFVARASAWNGGQHERLEESLDMTKMMFIKTYGSILCEGDVLTFRQGSNHPYQETGKPAIKFAELFAKQTVAGGRLLVVLNGWDGLSTNDSALIALFQGHAHICDLFVFADDFSESQSPRKFFQVDVVQLCRVLSGELRLVEEDSNGQHHPGLTTIVKGSDLPYSTGRFIETIREISMAKYQIAECYARLRQLSYNRNTISTVSNLERNLEKHHCNGECGNSGCDAKFPDRYTLNIHWKKAIHHDEHCQYCDRSFKNAYIRDRHERESCKKRPEGQPIKKTHRSKRKDPVECLPVSHSSEDGRKDYWGMIRELELAQKMPDLVIDAAELESLGKTEDIIYKSERVCRYPGCTKRAKVYQAPCRLRAHYSKDHGYLYTRAKPGYLSPHPAKQHEDGLEWLAMMAQGKVAEAQMAGKPWPTIV